MIRRRKRKPARSLHTVRTTEPDLGIDEEYRSYLKQHWQACLIELRHQASNGSDCYLSSWPAVCAKLMEHVGCLCRDVITSCLMRERNPVDARTSAERIPATLHSIIALCLRWCVEFDYAERG